jgi:hypothetical protein
MFGLEIAALVAGVVSAGAGALQALREGRSPENSQSLIRYITTSVSSTSTYSFPLRVRLLWLLKARYFVTFPD